GGPGLGAAGFQTARPAAERTRPDHQPKSRLPAVPSRRVLPDIPADPLNPERFLSRRRGICMVEGGGPCGRDYIAGEFGTVTDNGTFVGDTEPFRRELFAHCYRMLGSIQDAEDVVQETYLRAWRFYDGFEGRSSVRTWLYQIATNGCLKELTKTSRRMLPSGLRDPEPDPGAPVEEAGTEVSWLQPVPDAMVTPDSADPAVIVAAREGLRLALIASLQYLPPRQRAVLVLRDVLAFPAAEVAVMLGTTTVSVKSALQRARARLAELDLTDAQIIEPTAPGARALLHQYIAAFENADAAALERLLTEDATLEATPLRTWFSGRSVCVPFLRNHLLGSPGDW